MIEIAVRVEQCSGAPLCLAPIAPAKAFLSSARVLTLFLHAQFRRRAAM
jgi:hypothetical protein